ncbi:hypothetical protein [Desulfoluna spongiiphila]|uniref:hypothetical protein n=1 Tax=Desulfoluna spongiiphila TaxID=419481 RepID=UPI000B88A48E|nr:hypothetical protein [Desulfoluna spongiiphila]
MKERNPTDYELPQPVTNTRAFEHKRVTSHPEIQKAGFEVVAGIVLPGNTFIGNREKLQRATPFDEGWAEHNPLMFFNVRQALERYAQGRQKAERGTSAAFWRPLQRVVSILK